MAPAVSFSVIPNEKMSPAEDSSDKRQPASTHRKLYGIRPTADNKTTATEQILQPCFNQIMHAIVNVHRQKSDDGQAAGNTLHVTETYQTTDIINSVKSILHYSATTSFHLLFTNLLFLLLLLLSCLILLIIVQFITLNGFITLISSRYVLNV